MEIEIGSGVIISLVITFAVLSFGIAITLNEKPASLNIPGNVTVSLNHTGNVTINATATPVANATVSIAATVTPTPSATATPSINPTYTDAQCAAMSDRVSKDACYIIIAKEAKDVNKCGSVSDIAKDDCYNEVAKAIPSGTPCAQISASFKRDSCYIDVALLAHDTSLCNNVSNPDRQAICTG